MVRNFEIKCGFTQGSINRAIKSGTNIGVDKVIAISSSQPELKMDWLLSGTGEMLEGESERMAMNEPMVKYQSVDKTVLEKLSEAILNFSRNDEMRVNNEKMLIVTNSRLAEKLLQ